MMTGILIIEDNPQVRRLIEDEVRDLAAHLYEGDDGAEAVALYREFLPDWVLMDLEMKRVDGLTATRQIVAQFPDAHICIVTSYDDEYLREEAKAAGASGYVCKENLQLLRFLLMEDSGRSR